MDRECPKCGAAMECIEPDPETGIEGGWVCTVCEHGEPYEPPDFEDWDR